VLGEVAAICFEGKRHTADDLHQIVDLLDRREVRFLHPGQIVAEICYDLYNDDWRDDRMNPSDLVHLGYALAYEMDYFVTSDKILNEYRIPKEYNLQILTPTQAIKHFQ
jgi:hypothetical protein